ncbi:hypothetical protein Plhal304r1_c006g0025711 [Plasmopara halstedii]
MLRCREAAKKRRHQAVALLVMTSGYNTSPTMFLLQKCVFIMLVCSSCLLKLAFASV